jgi:hypothetical protein
MKNFSNKVKQILILLPILIFIVLGSLMSCEMILVEEPLVSSLVNHNSPNDSNLL